MKKLIALVWLPTLLFLVAGCGKSQKGASEEEVAEVETSVTAAEGADEAPAEEAAAPEEEDPEVEALQRGMLSGVLSDNAWSDADLLRECCTSNALRQLNEAYEYDDYNDSSLAVWDIHGVGFCDGVVELMWLKKVGPDTYQASLRCAAEYAEGQEPSIMEYKLREEGGQWKIDSYKQLQGNY